MPSNASKQFVVVADVCQALLDGLCHLCHLCHHTVTQISQDPGKHMLGCTKLGYRPLSVLHVMRTACTLYSLRCAVLWAVDSLCTVQRRNGITMAVRATFVDCHIESLAASTGSTQDPYSKQCHHTLHVRIYSLDGDDHLHSGLCAETQKWTLLSSSAKSADGDVKREEFDYLVLATGSFITSRIPDIQVTSLLTDVI